MLKSWSIQAELTDGSLFKRHGHFKYRIHLPYREIMPKVVPEYKEEAKDRILEAARQAFAEKGYHEATMDDVAKRIGVSKGALYLYFSSKETLFEELCRTAPGAFKDILHSTFQEGTNPLESAAKFFDRMMELSGSSPRLGFEILSEAAQSPSLRKILKQNQEEYAKVLMSFLEALQRRKIIDANIELHPLAYALIALWNGLETLMVSGLPLEETRRAWLEGFKAIFLQQKVNAPITAGSSRYPRKTA